MGPFGLFVVNSTSDALLSEKSGTELNIVLTGPWSHLYRVFETSMCQGCVLPFTLDTPTMA